MSIVEDSVRPFRFKGRSLLIKGGGVITMDPNIGDLTTGDVHVRDDVIVAVGTNLEVPEDAEIINASAMIVMPGMIDGHRHMWEGVIRNELPTEDVFEYFDRVNEGFGPHFGPDDAYLGTLVCALGAIDCGITTTIDWSHISTTRDHVSAVVEAMRESGMRIVFGYGPPRIQSEKSKWPFDLLDIKKAHFPSDNDLVTLAMAGLSPEHVPDEFAAAQFDLARDADIVFTTHAGMNGMGEAGKIAKFGWDGRLGPKVNLVHCNTLSADEWKMIADTGTTISITPSSEMQMGQGVPPVQPALDAGVVFSLGTDIETSVPGDMWTQMRLIYALQRMNAHEEHFAGKRRPALIDCNDLLQYVTVAGARVVAMESKIGSLTPGKQADIILLRADHINVLPVNDMRSAVALNMDGRNVDTVMVAGRILKRDGKLLGIDMKNLGERLYASRDKLFSEYKATLRSREYRL